MCAPFCVLTLVPLKECRAVPGLGDDDADEDGNAPPDGAPVAPDEHYNQRERRKTMATDAGAIGVSESLMCPAFGAILAGLAKSLLDNMDQRVVLVSLSFHETPQLKI